jgi:hypothetical protein
MTRSLFDGKTQKEENGSKKTGTVNKETKTVDDLPESTGRRVVAENLVERVTLEQVRNAVPAHLYASVSEELVDQLNSVTLATDPMVASQIRENFLGYTKVMVEGRFKIDDYLHAVKYVSYKLLGYSNEEAWSRTFPNRYQILLERGTSKKDISSHVSAYHKNKLVNLIMESALMPTWVLNQDMYQKALSTQYDLMTDTTMSGKVRTEAANSLLTHLAKPKETGKFQININQQENSGMKEMREMMERMAQQAQGMIVNGHATTVQIAEAELVPSSLGSKKKGQFAQNTGGDYQSEDSDNG